MWRCVAPTFRRPRSVGRTGPLSGKPRRVISWAKIVRPAADFASLVCRKLRRRRRLRCWRIGSRASVELWRSPSAGAWGVYFWRPGKEVFWVASRISLAARSSAACSLLPERTTGAPVEKSIAELSWMGSSSRPPAVGSRLVLGAGILIGALVMGGGKSVGGAKLGEGRGGGGISGGAKSLRGGRRREKPGEVLLAGRMVV